MEKPSFILPAVDFIYLCRFTSKEETRYYLKGVFLEPSGAGRLTAAATNGHVLGAIRFEPGEAYAAPEAAPVIISNSHKGLLSACKTGRKHKAYLVAYPDRLDVIHVPATARFDAREAANGITWPVEASFPAASVYVDGEFPDWRRVMPAKQSGERGPIAVNADYVALFGPGPVAFDWNGPDAILVANQDSRFLGVLVPMRADMGADNILARRNDVLAKE